MNDIKKHLLFLLIVIIQLSLVSDVRADNTIQNFLNAHKDFFHLYRSDDADFHLNYFYQPQNDEDGGPGSFDLNTFSFDGELPFPTSSDTFYRLGVEYDARLYDLKSVSFSRTAAESKTLQKIVFGFGVGQFVSSDLLLTAIADLGMFTEFSTGFDTDAFKLQGEGLVIYRINPGTQVLGGVRYSEDFDDMPLLPLIGFRLMSTEGRLKIDLTAPIEARVGYNLDAVNEIYSGVWISGDEYRVQAGPQKLEFNLQLQDRHIGGGWVHWFNKHLNFKIEGGVSIGSQFKYKLLEPGQFSNGDLDYAGYLAAGIGMAL